MIFGLTRAVVVASMTLTIGAALPGGYAHAADVVIAGMDRTGVSALPARKFDVFADGARVGAFDPYSDGARIGKYNPYADGARIGKPDSFTEGI
jgi:hypothetical protein